MRTGFALLLGVLISTPCAAQNGLEHINQGAKGAGRAGASTAMADDSLSAARNPALLTQLRGTRVDGLLIFNHERIRRRNGKDNVLDDKTSVWPIPFLSLSTDLGAEDDWDEFDEGRDSGPRLGFGIFQPMQGTVAPTATFAIDLSETFSFGVSLNVLVSRLGIESSDKKKKGGGPSPLLDFRPAGSVFLHYEADGTPVVPPQPYDPGTGSQLTWAEVFDVGLGSIAGGSGTSSSSEKGIPGIEYEITVFGAGLSAQVGFLWTPRDDVAVGLSIRSPGIIFKPQGEGRVDLTETIAGLQSSPGLGLVIGALVESFLPDRAANGLGSDYDLEIDDVITPASASLGVAWWPLDFWVMTVDVRWIGWSHSLDAITVKASGGTNRDLNEITGGTGFEYTLNLDWKDQIVVALGTTIAVTDWLLLRAGFNHGNNPIPANGFFNNSSVIENHLSLGAGLRLGDWDIDVAYVWGLPKRVDRPGASFRVELHQLYVGVGYAF